MIVTRRRPYALWLIACAALTAGGCASVSGGAQDQSLAALSTRTPDPKTFDPPAPRHRVSCQRPFDSLRPLAVLPPPGHMPAGSYMEMIRRRGTLRVGVDQNTLRLGYFNPASGAMEGLDIDLVRRIARAIFGTSKQRIVFKAISTAQRPSVVELGEVDLVASAYSITCERLQQMYFSDVYYKAQQKLLVLEDSTARSLRDLRGKQVCATKSSTSIENLAETGVVSHPVELRPDCLVELQEGRVAAITADDSILFGFKVQDPQTKIVGDCINVERYGIAINRRHPEFVRFVNGVLQSLRQAGIEKIRRHWLRGLSAPTSAQITRCDKRSARQRAIVLTATLRRSRRARALRARWCRRLTAPRLDAVSGCDPRRAGEVT